MSLIANKKSLLQAPNNSIFEVALKHWLNCEEQKLSYFLISEKNLRENKALFPIRSFPRQAWMLRKQLSQRWERDPEKQEREREREREREK